MIKSGNLISLAEEFDHLLKREALVKHIALNHERWFTKLGYSAASILCALPQLQRILAETLKTNLLMEACRLYVECELFITVLYVLTVFTEKVTLPFLNCLEWWSQKDFLEIFPRLYNDLLKHNTNTKWICSRISSCQGEGDNRWKWEDYFELYVWGRCKRIRNAKRERIWVWCRASKTGNNWMHKLLQSEIEAIKVNHNHCKQLLGTFSHCTVAGKAIRDDVVLAKSDQATVKNTTRKINKILHKKELDSTSRQKELRRLRIQKKIAEFQTKSIYTKKLLQSCKTWGGPVSTPNYLEDDINKRPDMVNKIVKT